MNIILEDLYFGNIDPNTQHFKNNLDCLRAMEIISDREEKLCSLLGGEEKAMFLEYINAWSEVHGETALQKFISGFNLGARLMIDVLNPDNTV